MSSTLRTALLSSALSLTVGCSFFSVEDADQPIKPRGKATTGSAGKAAAAAGMAGTIATSGGSGGTGAGGDAGSAVMGGSGGSSAAAGTGTGGTLGGTDGMSGGAGGMAPASGGAGAGAPPTGGAAGGGATTCAALNASAQAFGGHCYLLVTTAADFNAAKAACAGMSGAHLVTISNGDPAMQATFDAEDQFVYTLAAGKDTWLGLTDGKMDRDPGDGTPYKWITNEDNPPSDWGTAYGWVENEPNNYNKPCANNDSCYEHCGMMVADQGDKWNDDLCESMKQYVCEWDMGG